MFPNPSVPIGPLSPDRTDGGRPLVIGTALGNRPAAIWIDPREGRHLVVLGETGMGKSTLLVRLARQASRDSSIVLLDPIGDTALRFLGALPSNAWTRLLWIAPVRSPVAINALASLRPGSGASPAGSERGLDDLVMALRRVRSGRFGDTPFWGPRIEETVSRALRAASLFPDGTMVEAERLLSRPGRPGRGVPPEARRAVDELTERVRERPEEVDGARRLLAEIAQSEVLRRLLCRKDAKSSVGEWIAPGRITVVSGEAGVVGESAARYLLSVLLALLGAELLARPNGSKTVLILDEAQWYAHETAAELLRLGRRANVHLWLATQSLASLAETVQEAARTNAADFVLFRGSPEEAREFHRWLPSIREEALLALPKGHAVLLSGKGSTTEWVSIGLRPPSEPSEAAIEAALKNSQRYWVTPEASPPAEDASPAEPPATRASRRNGTPDPGGLLLLLWAALLDADPAETLELPLAPFRAEFDPSGDSVRELGTLLGRAGLLREPRTDAGGRVWVVRRDGYGALFPGGIDPLELAAATSRWREARSRILGLPP